MMHLWMLLLTGALAGGPATSGSLCFPSGFRIAVVHSPVRPVVGLAMVVDGGSSAEQPGEQGAAHLLEHLWFEARIGENSPTVSHTTDSVGAQTNAFTTHDETVYVTVGPRRALSTLVSLELARLENPLQGIEDEDIEQERAVVLREQEQRYGSAGPQNSVGLGTALFPEGHPYTLPVSGTREQVQALGRAELEAYAERQYETGTVTLYARGDLTLKMLETLVQRTNPALLQDASGNQDSQPCPVSNDRWRGDTQDPAPPAEHTLQTDVDESYGVFGWSTTSGFQAADKATAFLDLFNYYLRTSTKLPVECWFQTRKRAGQVTCYAEAESLKELQSRMDSTQAALEAMIKNGRDLDHRQYRLQKRVAELQTQFRERDGQIRQSAVTLSPTGNLISRAVEFHRSGGEHSIAVYRHLELLDWARRHLKEDRRRSVLFRPSDQRVAGMEFHGMRGKTNARAGLDPETLTLERLERLVVDPGLEQALVGQTRGGGEVWVLHRPNTHWNYIGATWPGGESFADPPVKTVAEHYLQQRQDSMHAEAWRQFLDQSIDIAESYSPQTWDLTVTAPSAPLASRWTQRFLGMEPLLEPSGQVRKRLKRMDQRIEEYHTDPVNEVYRLHWDHLSGDLPNLYWDADFRALMRSVSRKEAREFIHQTLRRENLRVAAVVTEDPERVRSTLVDAAPFRTVEGEASTWRDQVTQPAAERAVHHLERPSFAADLSLRCHLDPSGFFTREILEIALNDALNDALRVEAGATYGVYVSTFNASHGYTMQIQTTTPPEAVELVTDTVLGTLDSLGAGELNPGELARYKERIALGTAARWQTNDEVMRWMQSLMIGGYSPQDLGMAEAIYKISPESIAEVLAPCVGYESVVWTGPLEAMER